MKQVATRLHTLFGRPIKLVDEGLLIFRTPFSLQELVKCFKKSEKDVKVNNPTGAIESFDPDFCGCMDIFRKRVVLQAFWHITDAEVISSRSTSGETNQQEFHRPSLLRIFYSITEMQIDPRYWVLTQGEKLWCWGTKRTIGVELPQGVSLIFCPERLWWKKSNNHSMLYLIERPKNLEDIAEDQ